MTYLLFIIHYSLFIIWACRLSSHDPSHAVGLVPGSASLPCFTALRSASSSIIECLSRRSFQFAPPSVPSTSLTRKNRKRFFLCLKSNVLSLRSQVKSLKSKGFWVLGFGFWFINIPALKHRSIDFLLFTFYFLLFTSYFLLLTFYFYSLFIRL